MTIVLRALSLPRTLKTDDISYTITEHKLYVAQFLHVVVFGPHFWLLPVWQIAGLFAAENQLHHRLLRGDH